MIQTKGSVSENDIRVKNKFFKKKLTVLTFVFSSIGKTVFLNGVKNAKTQNGSSRKKNGQNNKFKQTVTLLFYTLASAVRSRRFFGICLAT